MTKKPSNPQGPGIRSTLLGMQQEEYEAPIPKFRFGQKVQIADGFFTGQIGEIVGCRPVAESFIYRIISQDFELMDVEERFLSTFS